MEAATEHPGEVIKRLHRCINNLVSLLALPATWSGSEPSQIVGTLPDVLLDMLGLDLAYMRLEDPTGKSPIEMVRFAQPRSPAISPQEIRILLNQSLPQDPRKWPLLTRGRIGGADMTIAPRRLGLQAEIGVIIAGSQRLDFPGQTEALLLDVAANQAVITLQQARHLSEQRRFAKELDRSVAQRTAQLAAANDELKLRVGLLQLIPVAAFTLNPDGTPDFVNDNWLNYSGQTLEFVRSKPEAWISAVHPDDRESTSKSFWDGVLSGHGFAVASRLRRGIDGAYRWHLNRAVPLRDAEGRILRFVGTSTDIDDLKQSQEALRKTEERTRMIIDTALDAVVSIDAHGSITSWNKEAEVIFGWGKKEAIGRQLAELIIPENQRAAHKRGLARFLAAGEGPVLRRRIELTAIRRGGAEFPVELEILPMKLGQDWSFSAFIRDITDTNLAKEKLRESELHLRHLTETIPEMLWSATSRGAIDYCNARMLDYTGFPSHEIVGDTWARLLHPEDVGQTIEVWASCVKEGNPYRVEGRIFNAPVHAYRWCVISAVPLLDQQGCVLKWYGTVVDMHDWKQAQEELRKAQANLARVARLTTVGELAASIAHEVNQPLTAVVTNANACLRWLGHEPPNLEEVHAAIERIIRDGNRGGAVIARIRGLVKKERPTRAALDVNEIIRETIALLQGDLQGVALRADLTSGLPGVSADRVQLQQVLLNLTMNAMEAMRPVTDRPQVLRIQTKCHDERAVLVVVEDSGIGLNSEGMEKLFETFYTTKAEGLGMGLSICRSIIEGHGGRLWGESNEGSGARFQFILPIDRESAV